MHLSFDSCGRDACAIEFMKRTGTGLARCERYKPVVCSYFLSGTHSIFEFRQVARKHSVIVTMIMIVKIEIRNMNMM